jgi:hypothetical protein
MEAKEGSDWKYTEAGKKAYDEYFQKKIAGYKKDSKEYKAALREKWAYDREYQERLNKASKTSGTGSGTKKAGTGSGTKEQMSPEEKLAEQELANIDRIQKRAEDAAKDELQLLKDKYEEEKALFEKYEKDTTTLTAEYEDKKAKLEAAKRTKDALKTANGNLQASDDKNSQTVQGIELEYSLKEAKSSGSLSFNDLIEETNKIYEANKLHLEEQAAEYKSLMENADIDDEARLEAKRNYNNTMMELDDLATQNAIDNLNLQKEAVEQQIEMYSDLANSIGDIFGSIADILEDDIKNKVKNGELTEEEGEKQFEAVKAFQIAQATIQTISGAIAAFMGCQSLGQPWGAIIGAVQAAAVTAAGIAQIAKIKNTQLGGGGSSVSSAAVATPVQTAPEEYVAQYTQNATGESEITRLADSIHNQKVYVVESDITEAQNRSKVRVTESTW